MKFPSMRRRPSSAGGSSDQRQGLFLMTTRLMLSLNTYLLIIDPDPTPLSRRRWRAFSGLKSRPVSTVAETASSATDWHSPQGDLHHSATEPKPNDKGKEREKEPSDTAQASGSNDLRAIHDAASAPGPSTTENREIVPSSEAILQELRDLQDTLSTKDGLQPNVTVDPKMDVDPGSSQSQVGRPLTPVPSFGANSSSGMSPASVPRGSDATDNTSHTALAEALGSWLGGRPRTENAESTLNDASIASSSRPYSIDSSPMYAGARPRHYDESGPSSPSFAPGALGSSYIPDPASDPHPSGSGIGQSSSSQRGPTLPPAGTGTLVVVQGVVHTTDVRQSLPRTPPTSQPTGSGTSSLLPSRSASSTPTLRASTLGTSSRPGSGSGASTPQPPSTPRRSRFSSLASGFRQRSRPHTPTSLRTAGPGSWRHGVGDPGLGSFNNSETISERSLGLGLAVERGISDSETGSTAPTTESSSTSAFVSTDDTSTMESVANPSCEQQVPDDPVASEDDSQVQDGSENAETPANTDTTGERRVADDREPDGSSDDESEAELSASSIEILGTLLRYVTSLYVISMLTVSISVATAATAASLVTGTTEPLFSSGLAGPTANGRNATPSAHSASNMNPAPPPPRPNYPSTSSVSSTGTDGGAEAAANTRMRAAWESLRDRFSRTRGRRAGAAGEFPGETREDPREQMLREMARVFNMGLGLEEEGSNEPRPQQEHRTNEALPSEGSVPTASQPLPEPAPEPSNRPTPEARGMGSDPGPEGSFERFLHNLQVDLRTALTEDYAARRARAQARGARANNAGGASSSNPTASGPSPPVGTATPGSSDFIPAPASDEGVTQAIPVSGPSQEAIPESPDLIPTVPNTPRTANLDLPHLPGDNDSQFTDGSRTPPQAQGITGQPGAGINWWRLYRFPPMQLSPHPSTVNPNAPSASGVPSAAPPPSSTSSQNTSRVPPSEGQPSSTDGSPPPGSGSASTQNVVPVIVVGLQSVPVSRADAHHHDTPTPFGNRFNDPSPSTDGSTDAPGRDRAWPLRAASRAFNRMGRRTDADLPPDSDMNSSGVNVAENTSAETRRIGRQSGRTYLIFVIGGKILELCNPCTAYVSLPQATTRRTTV